VSKRLFLLLFAVFTTMISCADGNNESSDVFSKRSSSYKKHYDEVYFRGTPNGWGKTLMKLVDDNTWGITTSFGNGSSEKFKFDIYGDWKKNFGASKTYSPATSASRSAKRSGKNIYVKGGKKYFITFNDKEKRYSFKEVNSDQYLPFIGPFITWNSHTDLNSAYVINYESKSRFEGKVEFRKKGNSSWNEATDGLAEMHHVDLPLLDAGTTYEYRVVGKVDGNDVRSKIYSFKTVAANTDHFKFIVASDMQDSGKKKWGDVANEMLKRSDIAFMIAVGDLAANDKESDWERFFNKGRDFLATTVIMPALGNHDTKMDTDKDIFSNSNSNPYKSGTESFRKYFEMPIDEVINGVQPNGTYYSFKYGNASFVALNSEVLRFQDRDDTKYHFNDIKTYDNSDYSKSLEGQYDWAMDKINAASSESDWVFTYWHIPAYNASKRHGSEQYLSRTDMSYKFTGKVDWVFNGHEHAYQRFKPMQTAENNGTDLKKRYGRADEYGVGYIVLPSAGQNVGHYDDPKGGLYYGSRYKNRLAYPTNKGQTTHMGFVEVEVEGQKITVKALGIGEKGRVRPIQEFDRCTYEKGVDDFNGCPIYQKHYDKVYFRGTANNWGKTLMELVDDNTWATTANFENGSDKRFKFDIYGDWKKNFGASKSYDPVTSASRNGKRSGKNITVVGGNTYYITFNDISKKYTFQVQ